MHNWEQLQVFEENLNKKKKNLKKRSRLHNSVVK